MARNNRRRARGRRPSDGARTDADGNGAVRSGEDVGFEDAPDPLEHATPDVELAEAQLALGRPELAEVPSAEELEAYEEADAGHGGSGGGSGRQAGTAGLPQPAPAHGHPERASLPSRFAGFLVGCWHELQRVQWPDRRQVMQATGVVLGFVVVAGVFLGVADIVASKLVHLILK